MSLESFQVIVLLVCAAILMWDNRSRLASPPESAPLKAESVERRSGRPAIDR